MKKTKNQEPTKSAETGVVSAEYDWQQSSYTGFEDVSASDLGIPFLTIIQRGSPEVDKTNPDYALKKVEGAEQGDILHTLSRDILHSYQGEPITFIPCTYQKMFVEWKPRESGGGIVTSHSNEAILMECKKGGKNGKQDVLKSGNIIVTTAYFFGMFEREGEWKRAVIGLTSTQLKKARAWLNLAMGIKMEGVNGRFTPPIFSHKYYLSTVPESNNEGSWFGWKVLLGGTVKDPILISNAIEFGKITSAGKQKLSLPEPEVM